jgi:hypothetical protein
MQIHTPRVIIMEGAPGTFKTSLIEAYRAHVKAQKLREAVLTASANDFFYDNKGVYHFDPEKLSDAHQECWAAFLSACEMAQTRELDMDMSIFVDNTNMRNFEKAPYILHAQTLGFHVEIFSMLGSDAKALAKINVHGVPEHRITQMLKGREKPLPWYPKPVYWQRSLKEDAPGYHCVPTKISTDKDDKIVIEPEPFYPAFLPRPVSLTKSA